MLSRLYRPFRFLFNRTKLLKKLCSQHPSKASPRVLNAIGMFAADLYQAPPTRLFLGVLIQHIQNMQISTNSKLFLRLLRAFL